jgi:hypothetical protein
MTSGVRCSALILALSSIAFASDARAQIRIELGATLGRYAPLGSFDGTSVHSLSLPNGPGDLGGAAFGGELRLWVAPRVGFAIAGSTVSSTVGGGDTPEGFDPPTDARVSMGSAQLLFRVIGDDHRARVWVSAGGGLVKHGGAAYEQFGDPVNLAGVFGVGSAIRLTDGLNAELGVTTMIYKVNMSAATLAFGQGLSERGKQTDLLLRTGLSYTIH